ncbi:MAG: S8 family serine peptidase [Myxococcota bacterium]
MIDQRRTRPCARAAQLVGLALLLVAPGSAVGDVPFPRCADVPGCTDPYDYGSYLFNDPANLLDALPGEGVPDDFEGDGSAWKYLEGTGLNVVEAWGLSTGRPDVVVAVLDSGIRWREADVRNKAYLNPDELPVPSGCPAPVSASQHSHDCNGDGVVNVSDFAGQVCPGGVVGDANGNGGLDAGDLILLCSDGVDGWGGSASPVANGYIDDISGWDFHEDDNDPFDDVDYGHGTGEAEDSTGEANDGSGFPGVAPSAMFLPLRVGDSFVALDQEFAQAVVYAVDIGAHLIQEALGTINQTPTGQAAVDYAYARGVPVMASAADEESRHHNYPAAYDHTIWLNSIRDGDGTIVKEPGGTDYDLLNGCTNYGGRAWVAISSTSCSSEATGRGSGLAALLISHGKNLVDAGVIDAWDADRGIPYSAEEVRQLFRAAALDIDRSDDLTLSIDLIVSSVLSNVAAGLVFQSSRFPTQAGWDQFTGFGRPDTLRLLELGETAIPPEADLAGGPAWFDVIDPLVTPEVPIVGTARAERADGWVDVSVQVGCGVQPESYTEIGRTSSSTGLAGDVLAVLDAADAAADCGFDPADPSEVEAEPDAHTLTLRLVVLDRDGRMAVDRRSVAVHSDPTLAFPIRELGTSGESSPALADVDRDGRLDVVFATAQGSVHVLSGDGEELAGFPAWTRPVPVHASPAWAPAGPVPVPHEAVIAAVAADDLEGDGRIEIVVGSTEGRLYVFDDQGELRPGFPVSTDPERSRPENRDRYNDADPGIVAGPTLADLDGDGVLEIVVSSTDGHLYVWQHDGGEHPGFPVRIADSDRLAIDAATGKATPLPGSEARTRLTKLVGSPAVGDLDGDGTPEILATSNEEYGGGAPFATDSVLTGILLSGAVDLGGFSVEVAGRMYAVSALGDADPDGPFLEGWPVSVPLLASQLLPNVATGVPGSPALARVDGEVRAAIFGAVGAPFVFDASGAPALGVDASGDPVALAVDFPGGGFAGAGVPDSVGSPDGPFFGALGSGAYGDLDGDGAPEYAAPTGGVRKLIDVVAAARQEFGDHQITVWDPSSGGLFEPDENGPSFPRPMDDMQFLSSPGLADVSGDGLADVVQGSGAYLVRAYTATGAQPPGWPKFTHGWHISSPTVGDIDGDGLSEVVALTREGRLFVWDTPGIADESAIQWQGFGRDRRNTGNLDSGVPMGAGPSTWFQELAWKLRGLLTRVVERIDEAPAGSLVRARLEGGRAHLEDAVETLESDIPLLGLLHTVSTWWSIATPAEIRSTTLDLKLDLEDALIDAIRRLVREDPPPGH